MNRKQSKGSPTTDNMRSSVNSTSGSEEVRGDQGTTSLKRAVARRNGRPPNRLDLLAGLSRAQLDALRTRFDAKWTPEPNTGCYLWTAAVNNGGYGIFAFRTRGAVRAVGAHRLVYELTHGPIAEGMDIDHKCRMRSCVNPAHLEAVTHRENMRRGSGFAGQNALKTHCLRGHELTPENTREHGKGNRACRLCERVRAGREHLNPLGLPARSTPEAHDARRATAEPTDWRTRLRVAASTTGARRVAVATSPYAARAGRRGELAQVVDFLRSARRYVLHGGALTEAVADGTLLGWRAREALNSVLDEPLANWDRRAGRTQLERLAVVERVLAELGAEAHRGGWSVGR